MQYSLLKTIIDTSLGQFACQNCQEKLAIEDLSIRSINEASVDLDLACPKCETHTLMHAEVGNAHAGSYIPTPENSGMKKVLAKNENAIKEADIFTLEQTLKHGNSIEDLLR